MMGKSDAEVIALFNEQVNMTADELEKWLEEPQNRDAGTGVGIESGRRIVEILRDKDSIKNPNAWDEVRACAEQQTICLFFFFSLPFLSWSRRLFPVLSFLGRKTLRICGKWLGELSRRVCQRGNEPFTFF